MSEEIIDFAKLSKHDFMDKKIESFAEEFSIFLKGLILVNKNKIIELENDDSEFEKEIREFIKEIIEITIHEF